MRLTIIAVGRLKETHFRDAAAEYLKRITPHASVDIIEIPDRDVTSDEAGALAEEGRAILRAIHDRSYVIALDLGGRQYGSESFAARLAELALDGRSSITFVIGGAAGLADDVIMRADERVSLGPMTLPHQLARVVLLEQVYRAFRINRGEPYHR